MKFYPPAPASSVVGKPRDGIDLAAAERAAAALLEALGLDLGSESLGEAEHMCMTIRGVQAAGSRTVTSTLPGSRREDSRSRQEFFALAGVAV